MNQSKTKQLKKMAEIYLQIKETKYLNWKQYKKIRNPTVADDRLYKVYKKMVDHAKRNYASVESFVRDELGREWRSRIEEEY